MEKSIGGVSRTRLSSRDSALKVQPRSGACYLNHSRDTISRSRIIPKKLAGDRDKYGLNYSVAEPVDNVGSPRRALQDRYSSGLVHSNDINDSGTVPASRCSSHCYLFPVCQGESLTTATFPSIRADARTPQSFD